MRPSACHPDRPIYRDGTDQCGPCYRRTMAKAIWNRSTPAEKRDWQQRNGRKDPFE